MTGDLGYTPDEVPEAPTTEETSEVAVGSLLDVPKGARVTRPDGETVTVSGGRYVLTQVGTYVVDGKEIEVK